MIIENYLNQLNVRYWFFDNLLWEIVFIPTVLFLWYLISALKISNYLLKNNRLGLGTGAKLYLADRFIEIWYRNNIIYKQNVSYSPQVGFLYAYVHVDAIDKKLIDKKLLKIERDPKNNQDIIKPIKNTKNKLTVFFIQFYLIHFWWDDKKYYKNLKQDGSPKS